MLTFIVCSIIPKKMILSPKKSGQLQLYAKKSFQGIHRAINRKFNSIGLNFFFLKASNLRLQTQAIFLLTLKQNL